jgi:hypothetical protein
LIGLFSALGKESVSIFHFAFVLALSNNSSVFIVKQGGFEKQQTS